METKINIETLAQKYNLDVLILFGSQATKFVHPLSDLDIAFYRQPILSEDEYENLLLDLMAFYKRADIDLVDIFKSPSALLRYEIFMHGDSLYEKIPGLFDKMKWQAYFDFEDFKKYYVQKSELLDLQLQSLIN